MPARMGRWGRPVARRGELVWCVQHTFLSPFCSVLFTRPVREGVFDRNTQTVPLRQACACSEAEAPYSLRH